MPSSIFHSSVPNVQKPAGRFPPVVVIGDMINPGRPTEGVMSPAEMEDYRRYLREMGYPVDDNRWEPYDTATKKYIGPFPFQPNRPAAPVVPAATTSPAATPNVKYTGDATPEKFQAVLDAVKNATSAGSGYKSPQTYAPAFMESTPEASSTSVPPINPNLNVGGTVQSTAQQVPSYAPDASFLQPNAKVTKPKVSSPNKYFNQQWFGKKQLA